MNPTAGKSNGDEQSPRLRPDELAGVGRLASRLSGELRQPLAVMRNAVYFLNIQLDTNTAEKVRRHLGILLREIRTITGMVDNLAGLTTAAPPDRSLSDVEVVVAAAVDRAGLLDDIRVETAIPPSASLFCDPVQLSLALANVLTNSAQVLSDGGTVRVVCRAGNGETVIEVTDDGPGMSPEVLARAGEPLFTTSTGRTGLGLPTTRALVGANGGTLEIESAPGQGTTVRFRFRRH
ncbi:MAG TPA: HAMP domain-containing histidine kinase [candidate division WOR-3 bacterium]|uniref:histidine kinase n=1 Tax=candidate division WOR-3 bacterium TaxID=2052148 RepID=A0A7V0XER3_UNCW3|nr:HAMP domain-containing histidine kinase [candidate division WOR-3 bacterium]